jgi:hypothetical protein
MCRARAFIDGAASGSPVGPRHYRQSHRAIESSAHDLGLSNIFIGVFVIAILGNAAEHATAITAALQNRMDLSLSIAIGSSVQIAFFVAPVLVLAIPGIVPAPVDLVFGKGQVLVVLLAALVIAQVAGDSRSDWRKGAQLLAVYVIIGLAFFLTPQSWWRRSSGGWNERRTGRGAGDQGLAALAAGDRHGAALRAGLAAA